MLNKLLLLLVLSLGAMQITSCKENIKSTDQKPNILFILADDLGYADLGCYGNQIIQTPNIDKLAEEGIRFTNCYAGASVCSPSRGTLMTGLHTGHARIRGNMCNIGGVEGVKETPNGNQIVRRVNLQPQDSTIANVLSNNGYLTCLINKWHLDGFDPSAGPLDRGFHEFYGWLIHEPQSHNYYPTIRWRNREKYTIQENLNDKKIDHNTDRATQEAIAFMRKHQQTPFFLYLAFNSPHVPLHSKELGSYGTNETLSNNDKSYAALITHMDQCIGQVLTELQQLKLAEKTIVIFASDNGGAIAAKTQTIKPNGNLRGWKGDLYEGGIRVPLIIRMPNENNARSISNFPCYFPDIMPTLIDLVGASSSLVTDGISLKSIIMNPNSAKESKRFLYWEQYSKDGIEQAIRWGKWKLISKNQQMELFNLEDDENEQYNIIEKHPEEAKIMIEQLEAEHIESENWIINKI
ncbi:MAG: sulfatase-like hydrolase/transferase [Mangrovibacterium sp.]